MTIAVYFNEKKKTLHCYFYNMSLHLNDDEDDETCVAASFATSSSSHMSLQPMAVVMVGGKTMKLPQLPPASQPASSVFLVK